MSMFSSNDIPNLILVLLKKMSNIDLLFLLSTKSRVKSQGPALDIPFQFILIEKIFLALTTPKVQNSISNILSALSQQVAFLDEPAEGSETSSRSYHDDGSDSSGWKSELGLSNEDWHVARRISGMLVLQPGSSDSPVDASSRGLVLDNHRSYMDRSRMKLR